MVRTRKVIGSGILTLALAASATTAVSANAAEASEASKWEKQLICNVGDDTALNIRAEASVDSAVVGKLYRGAGATVKKKGKQWTRIKSGDIVGYVKNEYCVYGDDAQELAEELCKTKAVAKVDGLRVRKKPNTSSKILTVLEKGDSLTVSTSAKEVDGWVAVKYQGKKAYVSADYVKLKLQIDDAVSIEEEQEELAAEQETTAQVYAADSSELALLAAIIQCEAGGESYAGQLAVGSVIMNRVRSSSFPGSISGVVYQGGQFAPVDSGKLSTVLNNGNIGENCYAAAKEALSGADNTGGALYFHAGNNGLGTVIGNQIFY